MKSRIVKPSLVILLCVCLGCVSISDRTYPTVESADFSQPRDNGRILIRFEALVDLINVFEMPKPDGKDLHQFGSDQFSKRDSKWL